MPSDREDGYPKRLAMFAFRTGGLLATAWLAAGLFSDEFVNAEHRWMPGLFEFFVLPWWLGLLWCWPAAKRPGWFFLASMTVALVVAGRSAARFYEIDPDLGREQARITGFWGSFIPATISVLLASALVWLVHRWHRERRENE